RNGVLPLERGADLGGDGEPRRDRDPEPGHLREPGALAAEKLLQLRAPVRRSAAESIDGLVAHHTALAKSLSPCSRYASKTQATFRTKMRPSAVSSTSLPRTETSPSLSSLARRSSSRSHPRVEPRSTQKLHIKLLMIQRRRRSSSLQRNPRSVARRPSPTAA